MHIHTHNLTYSHICILFLLLGNAMNSTRERLCACLFKNKYKKQNTNTRKCTKKQLNDQQTKGILCLWRDQPERMREREKESSTTSPSPDCVVVAVVDSSIGAQITKAAKVKNIQNCSSNGEEKFFTGSLASLRQSVPHPLPRQCRIYLSVEIFC